MINHALIPFSSRRRRFSPWLFGLKLGIFLALVFLLWWLQEQNKEQEDEKKKTILLIPKKKDESDQVESEESDVPVATPDDLTAINGIGPAYASILQSAGITTYAQLAAMDAEQIRDVFRASDSRVPNPSTWSKQAADLVT